MIAKQGTNMLPVCTSTEANPLQALFCNTLMQIVWYLNASKVPNAHAV